LLAFFLLTNAAIPLDILINFGEAFRAWAIEFSPNIFYVFGTAYWLEAPLLLLYVRSMVYKDYHFRKKDGLLFLPFVFYIIYEVVTYYSLDYATKVEILRGYQAAKETNTGLFIGFSRELFRLFLGCLCLWELQNYQKQIKNEFADIEKIDLGWLKILVIGFLFIYVDAVWVSLALTTYVKLGWSIDFEFFGLASNYTVMVLISALIFYSLRYSQVFTGVSNKEQDEKPVEVSFDKAQINKIEAYMSEHKPYLNCLLNLNNLAKQLEISPRLLSNIINRHYQQNFFEFINTYRIEESKRLLINPEHQDKTMLEIMDMAGFNSKATFNTFFKKLVGKTPSQFKRDTNKA
jgi:AraC-like DNA-binding protein